MMEPETENVGPLSFFDNVSYFLELDDNVMTANSTSASMENHNQDYSEQFQGSSSSSSSIGDFLGNILGNWFSSLSSDGEIMKNIDPTTPKQSAPMVSGTYVGDSFPTASSSLSVDHQEHNSQKQYEHNSQKKPEDMRRIKMTRVQVDVPNRFYWTPEILSRCHNVQPTTNKTETVFYDWRPILIPTSHQQYQSKNSGHMDQQDNVNELVAHVRFLCEIQVCRSSSSSPTFLLCMFRDNHHQSNPEPQDKSSSPLISLFLQPIYNQHQQQLVGFQFSVPKDIGHELFGLRSMVDKLGWMHSICPTTFVISFVSQQVNSNVSGETIVTSQQQQQQQQFTMHVNSFVYGGNISTLQMKPSQKLNCKPQQVHIQSQQNSRFTTTSISPSHSSEHGERERERERQYSTPTLPRNAVTFASNGMIELSSFSNQDTIVVSKSLETSPSPSPKTKMQPSSSRDANDQLIHILRSSHVQGRHHSFHPTT